MISKIEALHYGCFHYINQSLSNFNVLFGPNGSGKTVFLDIFLFPIFTLIFLMNGDIMRLLPIAKERGILKNMVCVNHKVCVVSWHLVIPLLPEKE